METNLRTMQTLIVEMIIEVRIKMILSIKKEKEKEIGNLMIREMRRLRDRMIGLKSLKGLIDLKDLIGLNDLRETISLLIR